jgi:hypothetical protein
MYWQRWVHEKRFSKEGLHASPFCSMPRIPKCRSVLPDPESRPQRPCQADVEVDRDAKHNVASIIWLVKNRGTTSEFDKGLSTGQYRICEEVELSTRIGCWLLRSGVSSPFRVRRS